MSTVKELKLPTDNITSPPKLKRSQSDDIFVKQKSRNEMSLSSMYYHSKANNFSVKNYNDLLEKWHSLNPDEKADSDFAGKKPSKSLYVKLVGKVNKIERRNKKQQDNPPTQQDNPPIQQDNPPLDLVEVSIPNKKKLRQFVIKKE